MKKKIIRITTVPISLYGLLYGQLRFMSNHYNMIGVSTGGPALERVSIQEGVQVIPVELTRKITPIKDLRAVFSLYRIFRKEKPFIVHTHTPKAGTAGMIAAWLARVPNRLHTIAGLPLVEATGLKRILLNTVEKITYACATKIYPNSQGLVDIVLENNFTALKKLKVIGNGSSNGIDTSYFDPNLYDAQSKNELRASLKIGPEETVFVYVGRLVSDKGISELVAAFKMLADGRKNVKLLLVGPYERDLDPLLPETENEINTNPNIIAVGWQSDVRPYFSIANALTFASYREGFPNVVMQAGAMGLFGIVTDINGCNEIIIEGQNGTIVPVKNESAFYEKMNLVCEKKLEINPTHCRQLILDRYEQKLIWNELLKEYRTLE